MKRNIVNTVTAIAAALLVIGWLTDHGGPLMIAGTAAFLIGLAARCALENAPRRNIR